MEDKELVLKDGFKSIFLSTKGGKVYEDFNPDMLFEVLGVEPDWEKINYYLLLDELF